MNSERDKSIESSLRVTLGSGQRATFVGDAMGGLAEAISNGGFDYPGTLHQTMVFHVGGVEYRVHGQLVVTMAAKDGVDAYSQDEIASFNMECVTSASLGEVSISLASVGIHETACRSHVEAG